MKIKKFNEDWQHYIDQNTPAQNELGDEIIADLEAALSDFGTYTYHDKGAYEVMNINKYDIRFGKMSMEEIIDTLSYVLDNHNDSRNLVNSLIGEMEMRSDFEEILDGDDRFEY